MSMISIHKNNGLMYKFLTHKKSIIILILFIIHFCESGLIAQKYASFESDGQDLLLRASEFAIPVSPAFDLLGVNPSLVPKPSVIRNFKVDWSFKSYGLVPNLALQTQPINEILFNTPKKLRNYKDAPSWIRFLSTLDFSLGTVDGAETIETGKSLKKSIEGNDSTVIVENFWKLRSFAYAIKLNLYTQNNPLKDKKIFNRVLKEYTSQRNDLSEYIKDLKLSIKETKDIEEKSNLKEDLNSRENELVQLDDTYLERMNNIVSLYKSDNWNASCVDIAMGQLIDYDNRDSSLFKFSDLHVINNASAIWLNGSLGLGKNFLLSSIVKFQAKRNKLINTKSNTVTGGINLRYGNHRYNVFIEAYAPLNLDSDELVQKKYLSLGGDWRFSKNVILNYGTRLLFNSNNKIENLIPVVSLSCMMR